MFKSALVFASPFKKVVRADENDSSGIGLTGAPDLSPFLSPSDDPQQRDASHHLTKNTPTGSNNSIAFGAGKRSDGHESPQSTNLPCSQLAVGAPPSPLLSNSRTVKPTMSVEGAMDVISALLAPAAAAVPLPPSPLASAALSPAAVALLAKSASNGDLSAVSISTPDRSHNNNIIPNSNSNGSGPRRRGGSSSNRNTAVLVDVGSPLSGSLRSPSAEITVSVAVGSPKGYVTHQHRLTVVGGVGGGGGGGGGASALLRSPGLGSMHSFAGGSRHRSYYNSPSPTLLATHYAMAAQRQQPFGKGAATGTSSSCMVIASPHASVSPSSTALALLPSSPLPTCHDKSCGTEDLASYSAEGVGRDGTDTADGGSHGAMGEATTDTNAGSTEAAAASARNSLRSASGCPLASIGASSSMADLGAVVAATPSSSLLPTGHAANTNASAVGGASANHHQHLVVHMADRTPQHQQYTNSRLLSVGSKTMSVTSLDEYCIPPLSPQHFDGNGSINGSFSFEAAAAFGGGGGRPITPHSIRRAVSMLRGTVSPAGTAAQQAALAFIMGGVSGRRGVGAGGLTIHGGTRRGLSTSVSFSRLSLSVSRCCTPIAYREGRGEAVEAEHEHEGGGPLGGGRTPTSATSLVASGRRLSGVGINLGGSGLFPIAMPSPSSSQPSLSYAAGAAYSRSPIAAAHGRATPHSNSATSISNMMHSVGMLRPAQSLSLLPKNSPAALRYCATPPLAALAVAAARSATGTPVSVAADATRAVVSSGDEATDHMSTFAVQHPIPPTTSPLPSTLLPPPPSWRYRTSALAEREGRAGQQEYGVGGWGPVEELPEEAEAEAEEAGGGAIALARALSSPASMVSSLDGDDGDNVEDDNDCDRCSRMSSSGAGDASQCIGGGGGGGLTTDALTAATVVADPPHYNLTYAARGRSAVNSRLSFEDSDDSDADDDTLADCGDDDAGAWNAGSSSSPIVVAVGRPTEAFVDAVALGEPMAEEEEGSSPLITRGDAASDAVRATSPSPSVAASAMGAFGGLVSTVIGSAVGTFFNVATAAASLQREEERGEAATEAHLKQSSAALLLHASSTVSSVATHGITHCNSTLMAIGGGGQRRGEGRDTRNNSAGSTDSSVNSASDNGRDHCAAAVLMESLRGDSAMTVTASGSRLSSVSSVVVAVADGAHTGDRPDQQPAAVATAVGAEVVATPSAELLNSPPTAADGAVRDGSPPAPEVHHHHYYHHYYYGGAGISGDGGVGVEGVDIGGTPPFAINGRGDCDSAHSASTYASPPSGGMGALRDAHDDYVARSTQRYFYERSPTSGSAQHGAVADSGGDDPIADGESVGGNDEHPEAAAVNASTIPSASPAAGVERQLVLGEEVGVGGVGEGGKASDTDDDDGAVEVHPFVSARSSVAYSTRASLAPVGPPPTASAAACSSSSCSGVDALPAPPTAITTVSHRVSMVPVHASMVSDGKQGGGSDAKKKKTLAWGFKKKNDKKGTTSECTSVATGPATAEGVPASAGSPLSKRREQGCPCAIM